jgi:hypothetical protein
VTTIRRSDSRDFGIDLKLKEDGAALFALKGYYDLL